MVQVNRFGIVGSNHWATPVHYLKVVTSIIYKNNANCFWSIYFWKVCLVYKCQRKVRMVGQTFYQHTPHHGAVTHKKREDWTSQHESLSLIHYSWQAILGCNITPYLDWFHKPCWLLIYLKNVSNYLLLFYFTFFISLFLRYIILSNYLCSFMFISCYTLTVFILYSLYYFSKLTLCTNYVPTLFTFALPPLHILLHHSTLSSWAMYNIICFYQA